MGCVGVEKIVKIGKSQIFGKLSVFCPTCSNIISDCFQSAGMKLPVFFHIVQVNHEKKKFTKIRSIYRRKKNRENRKKSIFWTILRFLSNLLEYYFRLLSICRYETPCVCSYDIGKP